MAAKRKHGETNPAVEEEPVDPSDELLFLALGGGNEVGRSCHIIQYKGKTVMLDAGMHPAYDGLAALPFYDEFDLSTVDVLLISHFHVDHAASLPYVLAKTNFRGRVFMTHPTKAIYKWLIQDSVRVGNLSSSAESRNILYTEADHLTTFPRIEAIDYYTTHTVSSIRITPYPAGHVLGAAMYMVEIAGLNILFTGDYSREEDRHLVSATIPKNIRTDVLICESTFGTAQHSPRREREIKLTSSITTILDRGGRALLPVFALGTAQELLLILDEYWEKHPAYQKIPIYYASNLARKCMMVYQTYISAMNDNIKQIFKERMAEAQANGETAATAGPWDFRFIRSLRSLERFDDIGSCVMLATPGMMQNGASRELLEKWAPDNRNGVIITGYSVEGTMANILLQDPETINAIMTRGNQARKALNDGREDRNLIQRRCTIQEYSFAAHVDGTQNREFVEEVGPAVVILVHGARQQMTRFKSKLIGTNKERVKLDPSITPIKVFSPANCEELRIPFRTDKIAKVVGKLAQTHQLPIRSLNAPNDMEEENGTEKKARGGEVEMKGITGVLVQNEFKLSLMAPEDLKEYAGLTTTTIICREHLTLRAAGVELIRWALQAAFGEVLEVEKKDEAINGKVQSNGHMEDADEEISRLTKHFLVMATVHILLAPGGAITVEWEGNMLNDGIADAVLGVLLSVETSPAAIRQSSRMHSHSHSHDDEMALQKRAAQAKQKDLDPKERLSRLFMLLEAQFGENVTPIQTLRPRKAGQPTPPPEGTETIKASDEDGDQEMTDAEVEKALERLHNIGIPVPGIAIDVNGQIVHVWLEDMSVESVTAKSAVLKQRVEMVVREAVECVAPLWG
ncbi:hypothetical protein BLS_000959 [Venturia inaequalis]|uniref:Uncharacterized protein n=1 Tax=Venturia inaequalis TaxID=5025 RepID=A0A8H3VBU0_VENIN|nr:hypothetical protein BLS_000959 [Venturia inaequalis]